MWPCIYVTEKKATRAYRGRQVGLHLDAFLTPALEEDTQKRGVMVRSRADMSSRLPAKRQTSAPEPHRNWNLQNARFVALQAVWMTIQVSRNKSSRCLLEKKNHILLYVHRRAVFQLIFAENTNFFLVWLLLLAYCMCMGLLIRLSHSATHTHTLSVGLLWTRDRPVAETSTLQHAIIARDRHPCPRWDSSPQPNKRAASNPRLKTERKLVN